jgi:hypothetical protein
VHETDTDVDSVYVIERILTTIPRLAAVDTFAATIIRSDFLPALYNIISDGIEDSNNVAPHLRLYNTQSVHPLCSKAEKMSGIPSFSAHAELALCCLKSLAVRSKYELNSIFYS